MGIVFLTSAALLLAQQTITQAVSRTDYLATWDEQFKQLDANGDGKVTGPEIAAKMSQDAQRQAILANRQLFAQLDRDGNGALSPDEFALLVAQAPPADPSPMLQRLDLNHDGAITLLENRTVMLGAFDALDTDKDGFVTPEESAKGQQAAAR